MSNPRALVLAIDDIAENLELLDDYLCAEHEVQFALSGPEGLELARRKPPDLVLLDVMMPGMDGYEVCAALKADPATCDIPVIFITAKEDAESESRALAAGAVDFVHKPINGDVLRARVRIHLDLKARERELRALNADLEQRVEERTEDLRTALFRADASHRAKQLFLANVNHELRTPISAILGLTGLVARQVQDPALRERLGKIDRAGHEMLDLVNDIIQIADLQANKIKLDPVNFDVRTLFDQTATAWRERAEAKGLALECEIDPVLPPVLMGDSKRLAQILKHLLSNAVKFSKHGRIMLRASLAESRAERVLTRIEVEDQGVGIDPERQAAIFQAFEQADNSNKRRYAGAGLGLALCKQLAELLGGRIEVESTPGVGSRFRVTVPFRLGRVTAAEPVAADDDGEPCAVDWDLARAAVVALDGLLANGHEIEACVTWARMSDLLADALGPRVKSLDQAMENFQFSEALECLRAARAACPQLAPIRVEN